MICTEQMFVRIQCVHPSDFKGMKLDTVLTLFAEKGYDGVGVDEIADAVEMKIAERKHARRKKI